MKFWFVLTKEYPEHGRDFLVCGLVTDELVAKAWAAGQAHNAYKVQEGSIAVEGWNAMEDGDWAQKA